MNRKPYSIGRIFIGRLPAGVDLLESLTRIANEEGIGTGTVEVYGTVARLAVTVFNQETRFPQSIEHESGMEIGRLGGTVSRFKKRALPKLSGVFTSPEGQLVAGTLTLGTVTHACEVVVTELQGGVLSRDFDMETGLPLWKGNLLLQPGSGNERDGE